MQAKDVPDKPVLAFLALHPGKWHNWGDVKFVNSVVHAMPAGTPEKVVLAKMRALIRRGLVEGCDCGCRGDFEITSKGLALVGQQDIDAVRAIVPPWYLCAACGKESAWDGCLHCSFRTAALRLSNRR